MHPWTLKAATPVGAATVSFSRAFKQFIKNDLPVPAVPEMIMCSGSTTLLLKCTVEYA